MRLLLLALCALIALPAAAQPLGPPDLGALGIAVDSSDSRPIVYTDGTATYWYGEAAGPQTTAWQGLNVRGTVVLDDWAWRVDGTLHTADDLARAVVRPDWTERFYGAPEEAMAEWITLLDGEAALVIRPDRAATFLPLIADRRTIAELEVRAQDDVLLFRRRDAEEGRPEAPAWLAIYSPSGQASAGSQLVSTASIDQTLLAPGGLDVQADALVIVTPGATADAARSRARRLALELDSRVLQRQLRMERLLASAWLRTGDADFDRAFAWARLSVDALHMDQRGPGLFAGLPWFNNYWGRDTFISLPGTFLASGQWEAAREILLEFARYQDADETSETWGRIPNFVSLGDVTYNTADGTPWFVVQAADYLKLTDDAAFRAEVWPVVRRATEAALSRTDVDGLLRHGDQETWMDASAGPGREWSPRGDRAVEIQALFYAQLRATADLARAQALTTETDRYDALAAELRQTVLRRFGQPGSALLIDHLDADGAADGQVRPNQLLAARALGLEGEPAAALAQAVAERLAYPWGVASLAQTDSAFHPYHLAPEAYPKDAAYHNGTIWTWNTGPLVSLMAQGGAPDLAYEQLNFLTQMALTRGAVGTMAENSDALPRPGQTLPRLTGTVSQAWTLAEYVRNAFEDFAGITHRSPDTLVVAPHLPAAWGDRVSARVRVQSGYVRLELRKGTVAQGAFLGEASDGAHTLDLTVTPEPAQGDAFARPLVVVFKANGGQKAARVQSAPVTVRLAREYGPGMAVSYARVDGEVEGIDARIALPDTARWAGFEWVRPLSAADVAALPAMSGPAWPLLPHAVVKAPEPQSATVRLESTLPRGDDRGASGSYVYPTGPAFAPGIFDATGLRIAETDSAWHFALEMDRLVDPGWNPQFGFQLTMAALAFGPGPGPMTVGREAGARVEAGYTHLVYVGGGVRVEDYLGNVLGEYRPSEADARNPLGSVETGTITFAIPKTVLPDLPAGTTVTLLIGGQDDNGGGQIGEFRAVEANASEWTGGGSPFAGAPRVYDRWEGRLD
jgi:glycogen debranching enzyme